MTDQTIVAVYDTPAHAEEAVQDLLKAGVPETAIHRHAKEGSFAGGAMSATERPTQGFWSNLLGGEPEHDTAVYDRSMESGSNAVSVKVTEEHVTMVTSILERHNPIDMDERARSYGLTQTAGTGMPLSANRTGAAAAATSGGTIQLSEETLAVGKRVVNNGTTRIRRYVVETPVEEKVSLHDERVTIERHKVTGGRAAADSFSEKTIEMSETAEEAVVAKTARVTEEINLRKEATDREETVRDTVRREDVEIVKEPGKVGSATLDTKLQNTKI